MLADSWKCQKSIFLSAITLRLSHPSLRLPPYDFDLMCAGLELRPSLSRITDAWDTNFNIIILISFTAAANFQKV